MPEYNDPITRRNRYDALATKLWTDRSSFDAHWKELGDWTMPRRTRFWAGDRNRGDKRNQNIIDSTARFSARTLQSGLHAGLTSPARPWMKLTTPDPQLASYGPVKEWLHEVTQRMLTIFLQTNLYNVLPMIYGDLGIFGTAAMSVVDDSKDLFRCYSYPTGSFALGMDPRGIVSTFVRRYELTVRQVVHEFVVQSDRRTMDWSAVSLTIKNMWDNGDYEQPVQLTWVVAPNEQADGNRLESAYKPFASCQFETGENGGKFLRERGFDTFPLLCPRWEITGEDTYGTDCPGMTALGDIKQLQAEQREKGKAIQKIVNPPLTGPVALRTQGVSQLPGGITYVDTREGMQGLRTVHEINLNLEHLRNDIGEVQYRIQRAFYEDLFLMLAHSDQQRGSQPVTAREVDERHEEKLLALGPVLERVNDELLDPLVDRVYSMMDAAGLIPDAPDQLQGVRVKAEYISIMAAAQKLVGVAGVDRLVQSVGNMVALGFPDAADKIDTDQVVDDYGDMLGVNPKIVRSTEEAQAMRAQRQKAQQAAADAEQAKHLASAVKDASAAKMSGAPGDTALNRVVEGAAQGAAA